MSDNAAPILSRAAQKIIFHDSLGEFDETWFSGVDVHIERMDETAFWIGFDFTDGQRVMLNTGVYRGEWYFNLQEDALGDHQSASVCRPRNSTKSAALVKANNEIQRLAESRDAISALFPDDAPHKHAETGVSLLDDVRDVIAERDAAENHRMALMTMLGVQGGSIYDASLVIERKLDEVARLTEARDAQAAEKQRNIDLLYDCRAELSALRAENECLLDSCKAKDVEIDLAEVDKKALRAELEAVKSSEGELEVWLCPVHKSLDDSWKLEPLDNCVACIRAERDSLKKGHAELRHGMNCPANILLNGDDCTCGLAYRIQLHTEIEMHAAWRKRAEESELRESALCVRLEEAERDTKRLEWLESKWVDDESSPLTEYEGQWHADGMPNGPMTDDMRSAIDAAISQTAQPEEKR